MNNDIAIFLDLDNIVIGATEINLTFDVNIILKAIRESTHGRVVLRRAYGDWRQNKNMPKQLATAGFELQSAVRLSNSSKNLADMQLVVDAMETLIDGHNFSTYVIVTGDRDFLPLVQTLRKRGKQVYGVGIRHTTSRSLIDLCDTYIFYEDIARDHGQKPFRQVEDLLARALDDLLASQEQIQASLLKEQMQSLSQGSFGSSPQGKKNFRKFLAQYPALVQLHQEGTTLYVRRPERRRGRGANGDNGGQRHGGGNNDSGSNGSNGGGNPAPVVQESRKQKQAAPMEEAEVRRLLELSLAELLEDQPRARASLLKDRLLINSQGRFDESQQGDDSFRSFLDRYSDLLTVQQSGSTLHVSYPTTAEPQEDVFLDYRSTLKKKGLRVVPPEVRLSVLREMIGLLQQEREWRWKDLVDALMEGHEEESELSVSKSLVHDVIRLAKRAEVVTASGNQRSLSSTVLALALREGKVFQEAVMRCDATYLQTLSSVVYPIDFDQASQALYYDDDYSRYLKVVANRISSNGQAAVPPEG